MIFGCYLVNAIRGTARMNVSVRQGSLDLLRQLYSFVSILYSTGPKFYAFYKCIPKINHVIFGRGHHCERIV